MFSPSKTLDLTINLGHIKPDSIGKKSETSAVNDVPIQSFINLQAFAFILFSFSGYYFLKYKGIQQGGYFLEKIVAFSN